MVEERSRFRGKQSWNFASIHHNGTSNSKVEANKNGSFGWIRLEEIWVLMKFVTVTFDKVSR